MISTIAPTLLDVRAETSELLLREVEAQVDAVLPVVEDRLRRYRAKLARWQQTGGP